MEEMKIRFNLILPLLFILCLTSCASTPSAEKEAGSGTQDVHKEKKQNQKKLLFEDWKYKGFGQELPVWLEAAFKSDPAAIKKQVNELADREIQIVRAYGINSDQADKRLRQKSAELDSELLLYDSSWALLSEKVAAEDNMGYPYFAAAVFYK